MFQCHSYFMFMEMLKEVRKRALSQGKSDLWHKSLTILEANSFLIILHSTFSYFASNFKIIMKEVGSRRFLETSDVSYELTL